MMKKIFILFIGMAVWYAHGVAQPVFPDRLFQEGRQLFTQENYAAALYPLRQFVSGTFIDPALQEEAQYMLACIAYELKEKNRIDILYDYQEKYPDSPYNNRIDALIASAYFFDKKYDEAIALFNSCDLFQLFPQERDAAILHLAVAYEKVGKWKEAAVWFKTLKDSHSPFSKDAGYHLAYIDYIRKQYDQALPVFLDLQDDPVYAWVVPYYIAEIYLLKKNYDKAEIIAQNYLSAFPGDADACQMQRILGEAAYQMEKYPEAVNSLTAYLKAVKNPSRKALYQLGMSYFNTRVYSQAAELLGKTVTVNDAVSQNAYLHMGLSYLELKERNKARMAFERAASFDFDVRLKEEALYNYALSIHETSYSPFNESVTVFERFLNEFPHSPYTEKVNDYLVEVYMNTRSYEAALRSIDKIASPGSRILEAKQKILFRLGTQAFANADFSKAIEDFTLSLSLGKYNVQTKADAYYWRGESRYRLGSYTEASTDYRQYLEFTQDKNDIYGLALYGLGYTAFKQKDYSRALGWFLRFTEQDYTGNKSILADAYNRLGDCYFHARNFAAAQEDYAKAVQVDPSAGDYSFYQEAFVLGLQKDYLGKIHTLNKLIGQYTASPYLDEALYERGRAYVQIEDPGRAIDSFQELLKKFPDASISRKAANEVGLLYYQEDDYPAAIQAYEYVIKTYPGSDEARLAQRDLKSVYVDLNRIDDYAKFVSSLPGGISFDMNERDSLTFMAAQKIYMKDALQARNSLAAYLQAFPEGAFHVDAHYYLGLIAYNQKKYTESQAHLNKVLEYPDNRFSEEAMVLNGEMLFNADAYQEAAEVYRQLKDKTASPERRLLAKTGLLRSAYLAGNGKEVILSASDMLSDQKLVPDLANEVRYYRAKTYLKDGIFEGANSDLRVLAKDTRNMYGAEAKYLLAQLYFDSGNMEAAEKELLDYIEQSTPHTYWLARSFILLSDVYAKMGRTLDARQYLLSLQQNYQAEDDIAGRIKNRLDQLGG